MRLPPETQGFWWPQAELLRWLSPEHGPGKRYGALITGYGGGKTVAGAWQSVILARYCAPHPVIVACQSFSAAKRTTFAAVLRCLRDAGMRRARAPSRSGYAETEYWDAWGGGEQSVAFGGGAQLVWVSSEAPDVARGINAAAAWLDEPASQPEQGTQGETWFGMIDARVREGPARRVYLTGTPDLNSWVYDRLIAAPPRNCRVISCSSRHSPYLPADYVPGLIATYGERKARAIVDGEWVDITTGQVYESFSRPLHVSPCAYDPAQRVLLAWDFNRDPMHVLGCHFAGGVLHVFMEWIIRDTTTEAAAGAVRTWLLARGHRGGLVNTGDPAGSYRSTQGARTDWDGARSVLRDIPGGYQDGYAGAHEPVAQRIARVNAAFRAGAVVIDPGCVTLIRDLARVTYKAGTTEPNKRDHRLTHASDALGYCLWYVFPGGPPKPAAPKVPT